MLVKAFRLFVSSTFADFAQEREILQSKVFPALDAYCTAKGYQFYPLDLRWGVSEEAHLDQRTAEICLGEVRAAKGYPAPNFLIMIGNRYGWVPLPLAIAQDEFEAVVAWLEGKGQKDAVRSLGYVYQRDDNYLVPPGLSAAETNTNALIGAYTLRSRQDDIPDLKLAETWTKVEAQLRHALQEAANQLLKLGKIDAAAHEKYFLSVTEQEIVLGLPGYRTSADTAVPHGGASDGSQAIVLIREIAGDINAASRPIRVSSGFFKKLFRKSSSHTAPPANFIEIEPRLDTLKSGIRRALSADHITSARATCDTNGRFDETYLSGFTAAIQRELETAIDRHIAHVSAVEQALDNALQSERAEHRAFADQKRKIFVGRETNLATIRHYIAGATNRPLVLHGRSGLGKSALMARAISDAEAEQASVIYRFIGASAASSDIRSLLISVVEDLAAQGIAQMPEEFEQDANKFAEQIKALLLSISKPVVVFLDALDQLRKPYRQGWLPDMLPCAVKLIVSVLDDEAYKTDSGFYRSLRQRLHPESFIEIEQLATRQGREILTALEKKARRRLQDSQRDYIIGQFDKASASPLYLRTAFEIACGWRSTDSAGKGRHILADDTAALIAQFIRDLSTVHHHAPELVSRTLGYLTAAKDGLSAKELTEVLGRDLGVMQAISSEKHGARTDKLPPSVWVRLNRQLAPFLVEKRVDEQPLLQFFHRQLANVAHEQYYEPFKGALHSALADYFETRAIWPDNDAVTTGKSGKSVYDKRSLSELPFQLYSGKNLRRLDQILMSPDWMRQKHAAFGPQALIADYDQFGRSSMQTHIGRTLRLSAGICVRDRRQLLPQLIGRLLSCAEPAAPEFLRQARSQLDLPVLLPQFPSLTPPGAETARLEGHTGEVRTIVGLPDGQLASGSADNTIRLWDVVTGAETARLEGHTGEVRAMVVMPDGRLASGAADNTIRLWDIASGAETAQLKGHGNSVIALAVLTDGRLASGSEDRTIRLWDVKAGVETARLSGHTDAVNALAILADGRLISGSSDRSIRLWDVKIGVETARFEGSGSEAMELALGGLPIGGVLALAALANGELISGWDYLIRKWNIEREEENGGPMSHQDLVRAFAVLPDGSLASGSDDRTIRLWNIKTGSETARLEGHGRSINGLALLADGRLASGSSDHTIRLWDVKASAEHAVVTGDGNAIRALALLPDGHLASGSGNQWGGTIRLWDPTNGSEITQLKSSGTGLNALASLPDGRLASGSDGRIIELWDLKRGASTGNLQFHEDGVTALKVLPDGRLASGSRDRTIRIWDLKAGTETARFAGSGASITSLTMLADGRLASGSDDGTIQLWDARTGAETARLIAHGSSITALAMLTDGRLASSWRDGTVCLWDVKTGNEISRIAGHGSAIVALAVLADGRLASGYDDRTVRLLDDVTGAEATRLELDASVSSVIALPGGRLAAGDRLGRLHWLEIVE